MCVDIITLIMMKQGLFYLYYHYSNLRHSNGIVPPTEFVYIQYIRNLYFTWANWDVHSSVLFLVKRYTVIITFVFHTLTYTCTHRHTHAHTDIHMHTQTYICTHRHTYAHTDIHMHTQTYICTHRHTYAHTDKHIHIPEHYKHKHMSVLEGEHYITFKTSPSSILLIEYQKFLIRSCICVLSRSIEHSS